MANQVNEKLILTQRAKELQSELARAGSKITEQFVNHKLSLLKDYNNLAILILGGSLTLLTVAPALIRTIWLFYVSSLSLASLVIINFFIQRKMFDTEEMLLINIEKYGQKLSDLITKCQQHPQHEQYFKDLDDLLLESFKSFITRKNWFVKNGQNLVFTLFSASFLGLTLSLLFRISISF